ncbi:uncharacterized protein MYCGRDRAFT_54793, partial [Zymoseptoria tritici IPO323]
MSTVQQHVRPRGRLYAFGSNGSGQLGIGHMEDVSRPAEVLRNDGNSITGALYVACGGNHTIVCLNHDELASTGENEDGRCITTSEKATDRLNPSMRAIFNTGAAGLLAATWSATFVVTSTGAVMVSGTGNSGELGLGHGRFSALQAETIPSFPPPGRSVVRLSACMAHVVAVLSNGEVWGWGKGRKGQLGRPSENVWTPRKLDDLGFFAIDAVCGKDFTCIFGSPSTGEIAVLGPSGNDRFGVRANAAAAVPGWKEVAASWGSIFVLLQTGEVVAWGRDDHGQLPPPNLPPLQAIAAGSEHCLGLTEAGQVLAWGWGEHGNCG